MQQPDYFIGLDLGKAKDYTALAVLERHGAGLAAVFHGRHLQRFPLGTSYPTIVADVAAMLDRAPLKGRQPTLAVDETGVGAPVVDLFSNGSDTFLRSDSRKLLILQEGLN